MTESRLKRGEICVARIAYAVGALLLSPAVARAQLPAPWTNGDVGVVGLAGSASRTSGLFTVRGSGADVWGNADGFHFVYQPMTGDGQIVARVDSLTWADQWSKAGVMMRDGLGPGDAHAYALVSAAGALRLQRRKVPGGGTASIYKSTASIPYWVRLVRTGQTFRAYFSADGVTWTSGGTTSIVMGSTIYVGLAVTSHNQSALATSRFGSVSVTAAAGNSPPVVNLTAPANGAQFDAPANITLSASASDPDGTIQHVQFLNGPTLIGTDTTSPYAFSWTNVAAGSYSLTAVARDDQGATRTSATVSVTVTTLTGPPTRAVFNASPDHAVVNYYFLEIYHAGDVPGTSAPVASLNMGKPAVVNNEISVDIATLIQALAPGSSIATVSAVNGAGSGRSAPSSFVR